MKSYLYLILDLFCLIPVFAVSFDRWVKFYKDWSKVLLAAFIVAIPFLAWDVYFTELGYWGFNSDYLIGVDVFNLPIEEFSFFIVVPWACLLIYRTVEYHFLAKLPALKLKKVFIIFALMLIAFGFLNLEKSYTLINFLLGAIVLIYFALKVSSRHQNLFVYTYLIHLVFFIVMNGVLTGSYIDEPIVWYNDNENLGIRVGTIPVEDFVYSLNLLGLNVILFEVFRNKKGRINGLKSK